MDGARGWMPAIWRPNVGRVLLDVDVEVGVTEDASSKGTKRKRAPHTQCGARGEAPVAVQGVQRLSAREEAQCVCKECGGSQICEHGRRRSLCKACGGGSICEHGRRRDRCKECGGAQSACTVAPLLLQGVRRVINLPARPSAL